MEKYIVNGIMETCMEALKKRPALQEQLIIVNGIPIYSDKYKMLPNQLELVLRNEIVSFIPYDIIKELFCMETQVTIEMR